jgi:acetyltransferase-like isoleucine patch superfamily enzyme
MTYCLDAEAVAACGQLSIDIDPEAKFGWQGFSHETLIETPANIRRGTFDIDFIGAFSYMGGRETFMRHVSSVGRFCSIASNVITGQMEHPTDFLSAHPMFQGEFDWPLANGFREANQPMIDKSSIKAGELNARFGKIVIGNDVWIGEGAFIRRGITIGDGAIVAARAVVTKNVPPYAIVGGSPARVLKYRFSEDVIAQLLSLSWWKYEINLLAGVDFTEVDRAIDKILDNFAKFDIRLYTPDMIHVARDNTVTPCRYDRFSGSISAIVSESTAHDGSH